MVVRPEMRAAVLVGGRGVRVDGVAVPEPGPGEVRIRVEGCGVCASNLPVWEGRSWFQYPLPAGAPGHEGWGWVDAVGAGVTAVKEGDRVAFLSGHAYAEYDLAPVTSLVRLPDQLADRPFPGEALGCAFNVFRRSAIGAGDTVAIVGIGFLGAVLTRLATRAGARVVAISRRRFALEVARAQGAAETIALDEKWRVVERVRELTDGVGCDCVIEAVGLQGPLELAGELTRERGRLVIAGYHQDGERRINMQLWNWRGLDVINAHERDPAVYVAGIRDAVAAIAEGELEPWPLFTHGYSLDELGDALTAVAERPEGFLKAVVLV